MPKLRVTIQVEYDVDPGGLGYSDCPTVVECAEQDRDAICNGYLGIADVLEFSENLSVKVEPAV